MRAMLDHVAIRTKEYDYMRNLFEHVFSMQCERETGTEPDRKLWFREGIQLCEKEEVADHENGYDHFCICVDDVESVMEIVLESYPEFCILRKNWFKLPNQTTIELKQRT